MTKNHKLSAVIRHEFWTIVKQPSFWIALVAFPLIIGLVVLIGVLTDSSDKADLDKAKDTNIAVIDNSNLIDANILAGYNIELEPGQRRTELEAAVRNGQLDGLIVYPNDLESSGTYQLLADNSDDDNDVIVRELGRVLLQQSLLSPIESEQLAALALTGGQGTVQTFTNGKAERTPPEYIVPGAFLVLFYIVLVFSVGYALTSVSEEKENRSIEMVLSYVKPRTLIFGKLLAIILVTLTQILFIGSMAAIAYGIARALGNDLSLPFKVHDLTFVPSEIILGLGFLVFGFVFYVGLMAMIGAIFPSSKEASGFSTVFFILPAIPFWGIDAIINDPTGTFTQILTYFPLTSTTTALIRNAAGNLEFIQGLISLSILAVSTLGVVALAAKAFRLGTLEYSDRIKLSALFRK